MIADQEQYKAELREVVKSQDIFLLREFSERYGIKLPLDDQEALNKLKLAQNW